MNITQPTMGIVPSEVEWDLATQLTYTIHQGFRYEYPAPIRDLRQRLVVLPPIEFGDQTRSDYELRVSQPHELTTTIDPFMNTILNVVVPVVESAIEFEFWVTVQRSQPAATRLLPGEWMSDDRLIHPSERTIPDDALRAAAAELREQGATGLDLAVLANTWVHSAMAYSFDVTSVRTNAGQALAGGKGVCQDYAHVLLAVLRLLGLPSLYVSGHMLGEGGTHAWVEVLLPASDGSGRAEAWPLDPTHGRHADLKYVTVAVGRDYGDVAPTSGSYSAPVRGNLLARKQVRLTEVVYSS